MRDDICKNHCHISFGLSPNKAGFAFGRDSRIRERQGIVKGNVSEDISTLYVNL